MRQMSFVLALLPVFLFATPSAIASPSTFARKLKKAMSRGDSRSLSKLFRRRVYLPYMDKKGYYIKKAAQLAMQVFFLRYPPRKGGFTIVHNVKPSRKKELRVFIAKYRSKRGSFRMKLIVPKIKGRFLIDTLAIRKK